MRDLTLKEIMCKKTDFELRLCTHIREEIIPFEKTIGVPIKNIYIIINKIDVKTFDSRKNIFISAIKDVTVELDFEAIE